MSSRQADVLPNLYFKKISVVQDSLIRDQCAWSWGLVFAVMRKEHGLFVELQQNFERYQLAGMQASESLQA